MCLRRLSIRENDVIFAANVNRVSPRQKRHMKLGKTSGMSSILSKAPSSPERRPSFQLLGRQPCLPLMRGSYGGVHGRGRARRGLGAPLYVFQVGLLINSLR